MRRLTVALLLLASVLFPWASSAQTPGALTSESLATLLNGMGLEVKVLKTAAGKPVYFMEQKWGTWTVPTQLQVSNTIVWLSARLTTIKEPDKVPTAGLLGLLEANFATGRHFFAYHAEPDRQLFLTRPLANTGVTAVVLKRELDALAEEAVNTHDIWNPQRWATGGGGGRRPVSEGTAESPGPRPSGLPSMRPN